MNAILALQNMAPQNGPAGDGDALIVGGLPYSTASTFACDREE
ncbi:hypothetical protein OHS33_31790 [Streptomyces sp. NBC_00536]|nr:hypothetical protein [Streptomyces sp. NBC_00536]WUC82538.1 hypothetical protein OHS33_31790 [Streptomyces sp. NBC_00536]